MTSSDLQVHSNQQCDREQPVKNGRLRCTVSLDGNQTFASVSIKIQSLNLATRQHLIGRVLDFPRHHSSSGPLKDDNISLAWGMRAVQ
mgnify:CR=1 FL=1